MRAFTIATAVSAILSATVVSAATATTSSSTSTKSEGVEQPSGTPVTMDAIVQGCWGSAGDLVLMSKPDFNSRSKCGVTTCQQQYNKTVAATYRGTDCYCGDKYPPLSALVDDSECDVKCPGYGQDACGGRNAWTVYNTGLDLYGVEFSADTASSSSSAAGTAKATQTASSGSSQTSSAGDSSSSDSSNSNSGSSNTVGIAVGAVVGILALAGIGGGVWFFMRRRRNQEIEEEHRRNAAVNAFINGSKPPSSSGGLSMTDSRMDPVMAHRRLSDGSIADNQDYSRRILRVTNA